MSELMNVVAMPLGTDWYKVTPIKLLYLLFFNVIILIQLGLALGLDQIEDLKVIESENFGVIRNCCQDMFALWKRKSCSPYRWSTIDQALRSKNVQKHHIADDIHKRRSEHKRFSGKNY